MKEILITLCEIAAVLALIYCFVKERWFIALENMLMHNIRVAVVRCLKRSRCFMAWLNDESVSQQLHSEYVPSVSLRNNWQNTVFEYKNQT